MVIESEIEDALLFFARKLKSFYLHGRWVVSRVDASFMVDFFNVLIRVVECDAHPSSIIFECNYKRKMVQWAVI